MNKEKIKTILIVLLSSLIYALTVKLFIIPSGLVTGGTTGIGLAMGKLFNTDLSVFIFLVNFFLLVIGVVFFGKEFGKNTILATLSFPVMIKILDYTIKDFYFTSDIFLCTIFAGIGIGVSIAMCMRVGASTGGLDIPPMILNKLFRFPIGISMYIMDFFVLLLQGLCSSAEEVMYGIVLVMIYSMVLDKLLLVGKDKIELKIISNKKDEIRKGILEKVDRGLTILHGEGGYTGNERTIILSVIDNKELIKIEKIVHIIDPEAFIIVSKVNEVAGKGFTLPKDYI